MKSDDVKDALLLLSKVFENARQLRAWVISQGENTKYCTSFEWLDEFLENKEILEEFDGDVEKYFNMLATLDCVDCPKSNDAKIPFMIGWETRVQKHLEIIEYK